VINVCRVVDDRKVVLSTIDVTREIAPQY